MRYNRQFARRQWRNQFPGTNTTAWRSQRQKGRTYSFRNFIMDDIPAPSSEPPTVAAET